MTPNTEVLLDDGLQAEEVVGLEEFAEDGPQGAWPKGWYTAEVIEGFQTRKGKQVSTGDFASQDGASRNLKLCISVAGPKTGESRTLIASLNYRISDFGAERMAFIKDKRAENKGVRGRWADTDAQRSSLALASIGGISKAVGFAPKLTPNGTIVSAPYVGQKFLVFLGEDEKGFNEITHYAKLGDKTSKSAA